MKRTARYLRVDMAGNYITGLKKSKTKLQSTPNNSNFQGKSKKVRVIGSSKKKAGVWKKQFLLYSEHFNHS